MTIEGPHVTARLTMIPTDQGGRRSAVYSGYRPQFRYLNDDNDISLVILDRESIEPGESADVQLWFFRPDLQIARLKPQSTFELAEGARAVAQGIIVDVLCQELINRSLGQD